MNNVIEAFRSAIRALRRHRLRSGLTLLGIVVGVASLVVVAALSAGVGGAMDSAVAGLGSSTLFVLPDEPPTFGPRSGSPLSESDAAALSRELPELVAVAPVVTADARVVHGDRSKTSTVLGTTRAYLAARHLEVGTGETWDERAEVAKEGVCLLGESVRRELFGDEEAVGATVRVGRAACRVIGVLLPQGTSLLGTDRDDRVLMPIGAFRVRLLATAPSRVEELIASAASPDDVELASRDITALLRQRHGLAESDANDFQVRSQAEVRGAEQTITGGLSVLLLAIAGISVVVGGVGVANTMLVSVAERTREIGVRMALGATPADVFWQFVIESITLCGLGSAVGTVLGISAGALLGFALGWSGTPATAAVVLASLVSGGVGFLAGVVPARRAAQRPPIQALRGR